jgi:hypothetical protein
MRDLITDDKKIQGLPRRPHLSDASAATVFSGIALGLLTGSLGIGLASGAIAGILANQRQPLELAIREYFTTKNLEVIFFNRAARMVRVSFSYAPNAYWTVESVIPDSLTLSSQEDCDDWLYGSLTRIELPKIIKKIKLRLNR